MTVGELIALLSAYPEDMMVVVAGYEAGYDDAKKPVEIEVVLNHEDGGGVYGTHMSKQWVSGKSPLTKVVVIERREIDDSGPFR